MTQSPGEPLALNLVPALTIEIDIGAACQIKFTGREQQETVLNPKFTKHNLATLRLEVKQRLAEFSARLATSIRATEPRVDVGEAMVALREMQRFGCYVLLELMGEGRAKLPKIVNLVRSACTGYAPDAKWTVPRWGAQVAPPQLIVFKTSVEDGIPVDILPLLDPYGETPDVPEISEDLGSEDFRKLGPVACSFLGFSAIVKRDIGNALGTPRHLENIPRLPVKMFINRSLRGARQEETHLTNNADIDIDPGWPDDQIPPQTDFAGVLATHLWEVGTRFGGSPRAISDQICHFACHSDTGVGRLPMNYEIGLQSRRLGSRRNATLQDLTVALSSLSGRNADDRRPRPLIFMNSCGSGDLDPAGAASFPNLFLNRSFGFLGFIGTEAVMPDDFAAEFSRIFYDKLIHGATIGEAMLSARWDLLKAYRNPLGLMYTLFAEPEIRVRRPVPQLPVEAASGGKSGILAGIGRLFGRAP
jgi:hypothetical protein